MSSKEVRSVLKNPNSLFKSSCITVWFAYADKLKVGFNINKKKGSAVQRNQFKRRVRGFLSSCNDFNSPFFCVIAPNIKLDNNINLDLELSRLHSWILKKINRKHQI